MKKTQLYIAAILLTAIVSLAIYIYQTTPHKRYAIFAGYNAEGIIPPYVITYLKNLNEVTDGVIYIADSTLAPQEEQKLKGLVLHTEHQRHNEYDWGSYKRGYLWLKENGYLNKAKELVFCNDSTYPIGSLKPMFNKMDKQTELDFWGDSQNTAFANHLQSYFLVIKHPVFSTQTFNRFMTSITHQEHSSQYITTYEVNFTPTFSKLGYKWDSYIPYKELAHLEFTDKNSYPLTLIKDYNHSFLKRRTFTTNLAILEDKQDLLRYIAKHYPKNYQDIKESISPDYIPEDLKGAQL